MMKVDKVHTQEAVLVVQVAKQVKVITTPQLIALEVAHMVLVAVEAQMTVVLAQSALFGQGLRG